MLSEGDQQPPFSVGVDLSFARGIDEVLALGLWLGLGAQNKIRLCACTVSRNDLDAAIFCDVMAGVYFPKRNLERDEISGENRVGLSTRSAPLQSPVFDSIIHRQGANGKPIYGR